MSDIILGLISGVCGGGGLIAILTAYLLNRRKQVHVENMELLPHLVDRLAKVESAESKCQEERTVQAKEMGAMAERIKSLEQRAVTDQSFRDLSTNLLAMIDKHGVSTTAALDNMKSYLNTRVHDLVQPVQTMINKVDLLVLKDKTTGTS